MPRELKVAEIQDALQKILDMDSASSIPDYAPMSLLSQYIRPGDQSQKVETPENKKAIAVKNENRIVVFLENKETALSIQNIELAGEKYTVELPAKSLCAFVFKKVK